jgi:putative two-component system response regulator
VSRILVIDDEPVIRDLMLEILEEAGYEASGAPTAEHALRLIDAAQPDLVVSDVIMPGLSGLELLEEVRTRRPSTPVVLVTGAGTYATLTEALTRGAAGLVMKPFSHAELRAAVSSALDRSHRSEQELETRVLGPALATALANAIEARDSATHGHCERLATLAVWVGRMLGLAARDLDTIRLGAILHDVGKIGIPDRVLLKRGPFTAEEEALMRTHPVVGDHLLEPLDLLAGVRPIVRHHHERWDGGGYPDGLAGEAIPFVARIVAVADAVEAMWAERPYRGSMTVGEILAELELGKGTQWDPVVVGLVVDAILCGDIAFSQDGIEIAERGPGDPAPRVSVLLVEDDRHHAETAVEAIRAVVGDARIVVTGDIASAGQLCRGSVWSLVVLDHDLPDGDGLDALGVLRDADPTIPVLMLTGQGSDQAGPEAFRRGASDYVVKGAAFADDLAGRIRNMLAADAAPSGSVTMAADTSPKELHV